MARTEDAVDMPDQRRCRTEITREPSQRRLRVPVPRRGYRVPAMRTVETSLPWGSRVEHVDGRPVRVCDRDGNEVCCLRWTDGELARARLHLPSGRSVEIETDAGEHPLFGRVDRVSVAGEDRPRVSFAAVRWSSPEHIPPLDRPGALVSGAGTAILNLLARRAAEIGIPRLRYRGPYPTAALFSTLAASFHVQTDPAAAASLFSADVETRALRGEPCEVAVDFEPAPHEWLFVHPRVCVQARADIERVYVDARAYVRDEASVTRLRDDGDTLVAGLEVAGRRSADIARLDRRGTLRSGPHPIPETRSPLVGMELPRAVVDVLAEVLHDRAPAMMRATLRRVLRATTLRFDDTKSVLARRDARGIQVHALLGEQLDEMEPRAQLGWLIAAVEPVVQRWSQEILASDHPDPSR